MEEFIYKVEKEGYQPREEEIKLVGELLGQPTKKLSVVLDRYWQVFTKYIEKKCTSKGNLSICIYSWKFNVPFRVFPMSLHAFGTIIMFEDQKPTRTIAYPFNKPLSYAKAPGLPEEEYGDKVPSEVSLRIDGWQVTAYYNPLINKWTFATRHALHNMYYKKNKLIEEPIESIVNPYVYLADAIAEKEGLYDKLDKYRNWTFTFVLEGPEPAITRPPYPIGVELEKFKLYLLLARDPTGRLYTWSKTKELLSYNIPPLIRPSNLRNLFKEVKKKLDIRSYLAFINTGDPENPLLIELESDYYPEAMNVRYLNDAKSAIILISEGKGDELANMLEHAVALKIQIIQKYYNEIESMLTGALNRNLVREASDLLIKTTKKLGKSGLNQSEVLENLRAGNIKRIIKKTLAILLEGSSLLTDEPLRILQNLVNELKPLENQIFKTPM